MLHRSLLLLILTVLSVSTALAKHESTKDFPLDDYIYQYGDSSYSRATSLFGKQKIVLTFDDGPHRTLTPKLLGILKKHKVKATFFMRTYLFKYSWAVEIAKNAIRDGHTIASHSVLHLNSNRMSKASYTKDLKSSILAIKKIYRDMGRTAKETYYRFPFGAYGKASGYHHLNVMKDLSQDLFGENCINYVFWDIDTNDWVPDMNSGRIIQHVFAEIFGGTGYYHVKRNNRWTVRPTTITNPIGGGIVLMHDTKSRSVNAVDQLLTQAKAQNVEIVQLKDVENYRYDGKTCELLNP